MTGHAMLSRLARVRGGGRRLAVATLTVVAVAAIPAAAAAAQAPAFAISPADHSPYFILRLAAGITVQRTVRITNVGDRTGQVRLAGVDATTGQTSGAVYLSPQAPRRAVGGWLSLATSSLTLGPHQSALVRFTVAVPAGARAGEHLGGLVAAPVQPVASQTTRHGRHAFRVQVNEVSVVGVEIRVPGPQSPGMAIGRVTASGHPGYQTLLIGLSDTGNTLVKGQGRLVVTGAASGRLVDQPFTLDTFVPDTSIAYPVYLKRRLAAGKYRATVTLSYDGHRASSTSDVSIDTRQVRQTYGSTVPAALGKASAASSSTPLGLLIGGAVALLVIGIGGTALYFRSRLRAAQRTG